MPPIVSIIIPVYNRPVLVAEAIESVLAQTNPKWELIVVDDGSTDNTWEVLESYAAKDERIRVFKRDREPKGAPTCRNMGAGLAKSDYLVFLDSDDLLGESFVETREKYIKEYSELDFIVFPQIGFEESPKIGVFPFRELFGEEDDLTRFLKIDLPWMTTGPVWRRDSFFSLGCFDERLQSSQEWDLNIRAILSGLKYHKVGKLEKEDIFFRFNRNLAGISNSSTAEIDLKNKAIASENFLEAFKTNKKLKDDQRIKRRLVRFVFSICLKKGNQLSWKDARILLRKAMNAGLITQKEKKLWHLYFSSLIQKNHLLKRLNESIIYRWFPEYYYF